MTDDPLDHDALDHDPLDHDPLDDAGRALFASARNEQPDQALLERVLGLDPAGASPLDVARTSAGPPKEQPREEPSRRSRRRRLASPGVWLAALAACGLAVLGKNALDTGDRVPSISAEQHAPNSGSLGSRSAQAARSSEAPEGPQRTVERHVADPSRLRDAASPPAPPRAPEPTRAISKPERAPAALRSAPSSEPPKAGQSTPQPALLAEVNLLKQARTALRGGDASLALTLLDRYSGEMHGTDLNAEATLLRIETLTALDRKSDAAQLAERFVAENPDSPLVDRARSFAKARGTAPNAHVP